MHAVVASAAGSAAAASGLDDLVPVAIVLPIVGVLTVFEAASPLGLVLATEPVLALAGALLSDPLSLAALVVLIAVAGTAADAVAHHVGVTQRDRIRDSPLVARLGAGHWSRVERIARSHGARAVLLAKFVPIARAVAPTAAGVVGTPLARVLAASFVGSLLLALLWVGAGALLRASLAGIGGAPGRVAAALVAAAIGATLIVSVVRSAQRPADGGGVERDGHVHFVDVPVTAPVPTVAAQLGAERTLRQRLFVDDEWRTVPNLITAVRLGLLVFFPILLDAGHPWWALGVAVVVFAGDGIDGAVARRTGQISAFGSWFDPIADRITAVVVVISFAAADLLPWAAIPLVLVPDLAIGLLVAIGFGGRHDVPVTWLGKARTALLFAGLAVLLFADAVPAASGVATGVGTVAFALGLVGHWVVGVQYVRSLDAQWRHRVAQ